MSAQFELECGQASTAVAAAAESGHRFRGKLLDRCGCIESWAVKILTASGATAPHYFTPRLEAVRNLTSTDPSPLKSPDRVRALLDRFKPYIEVRSTLAHSEMQIATGPEGEMFIIFKLACEPSAPGLQRRHVFTRDEMKASIAELGTLANELSHQVLAS